MSETTDAVAQAREALEQRIEYLVGGGRKAIVRFDLAPEMNALIAAVRAECADKYETALTAVSESGGVGRVIVERVRKYVAEAK